MTSVRTNQFRPITLTLLIPLNLPKGLSYDETFMCKDLRPSACIKGISRP